MKFYSVPFVLGIGCLILSSCSSDPNGNDPVPPVNPDPVNPTTEKLLIKINPSLSQTKATDYGFETGDQIGLFVVNYNGPTPGTLLSSGNHVDNMRHTYSGTWTPDTPIYWEDNKTSADIYMYHPYTSVSSVSEMPFNVKANQSIEADYKASDLLWGKATNVAPTQEAIAIVANHVMSRIQIALEAGNGFTKEGLAQSSIDIKINGLKTESKVNLSTSSVTPIGTTTSMIPFKQNDSYKALIVPQSVDKGNLITITVDGKEYNFNKEFTFVSGKTHNFTITLSKTSTGVNVTIGAWDNDGTDNGGIAE